MLPPTINKHKAVWASSIAIFTLGAVVYFTVYRNSKESSSKPSKKPIQDREIVHKEKKQIDEETSKGRDISNQVDVSQVKATVTLEETDSNQVTSDQQIKVTETEKDAATTTETNTMTTTTTTTAIETSDNNNNNDELTESIVQINHQDVKLNDSFVMVSQSTDEKKPSTEQEEDDEIEKSPLLTAAPSSSSSSDIASQPDQESKVIVKPTPAPSTTTSQQDLVKEIKKEKQQDEIKKKSMAATTTPSVRSATTANHLQQQQQQQQQQHMMMNVNNTNGMYINGYWHAPTATTTFQHSMGWPELFPLQQQQHNNNNNSNNNEMNQHVTTLDESTMDEAALKKYNQKEKKRSNKKKMTRLEQIDQQKQNYVPSMKSRCNWWPNCTNKNCKYFHPHQPCRYGDLCIYNERCMFLHPWDYEESYK
ncbi:unnamed protein product [Cunninghamella echinulata]